MKKFILFVLVHCLLLQPVYPAYMAQVSGETLPFNRMLVIEDENIQEKFFNSFNDGLMCVYEHNGYSYYINAQGETVLANNFSAAGDFSQGLAPVKSYDGLTGYINIKGEYVIAPQFVNAEPFVEGKAIVQRGPDRYAIIDTTGKVLTEEYTSIRRPERNNDCFFVTKGSKSGLLGKDLQVLLGCEYDGIANYASVYMYIEPIPADYLVVELEGKSGIYSFSQNKIIVPIIFIRIKSIAQDCFSYSMDGKHYGIMDFAQNVIMEPNTDDITPIDKNTFLLSTYDSSGSYNTSIIDAKRNVIKSFENSYVKETEAGNLAVLSNNNSKTGLYSTSGKEIVPIDYNMLLNGTSGLTYASNKNSCDVFDASGAKVTTYSFAVTNVYDTLLEVQKNELHGLADLDGNVLVPCAYDYIMNHSSGMYPKYNGQYMGYKSHSKTDIIIDTSVADIAIPDTVVTAYQPLPAPDATTIYLKPDNNRVIYSDGAGYVDIDNPRIVPFIENERTLVPIRCITEAIRGSQVLWNAETRTATFSVAGRIAKVTLDSPKVELYVFNPSTHQYDASTVTLEVPARVVNDRTFVPLRAVSELLGIPVGWDDAGVIGVGVEEIQSAGDILPKFNPGMFNLADFPIIDGSTACFPFFELLIQNTLDVSPNTAYNVAKHSTTHYAYVDLIDKRNDIIFVTQPSEEELEYANSQGVELEVVPFCNEGFVFLTNAENPVDNLTHQQIVDIYSGNITNWKEVGGSDTPIIPYQRPTNSGSQTVMEQLVMEGSTMAVPPSYKIPTMFGLIDAVAEYDNAKNALGYSVYFFTQEMHNNDKVKLIKVNGVFPDKQTLYDNSYPYIIHYYAVIRKSSEPDSPERRLLDYILNDGQQVVEQSGLVRLNQ